jgi:hypothetical protein
VATEFTVWEQHLLSEHRLREKIGEIKVGLGMLGLITLGGASCLVAGWCGVELPELAWDLAEIGTATGAAGIIGLWRQWSYLALLKKLRERIAELEVQLENPGIEEGTTKDNEEA